MTELTDDQVSKLKIFRKPQYVAWPLIDRTTQVLLDNGYLIVLSRYSHMNEQTHMREAAVDLALTDAGRAAIGVKG